MAIATLRSYRDPIHAELAKARLESAGIPAVVVDQYLVSMYWLYSLAIGGVKVQVDESDLATARAVLREDRSADLASIPESQVPPADGDHCPACGSPDVQISRVKRNVAAFSLAIGFPIVAWRHRWICRACNHSWKQHPAERAAVPPETLEAERRVYEHRTYPRSVVAVLLGIAILHYVWLQIHSSG